MMARADDPPLYLSPVVDGVTKDGVVEVFPEKTGISISAAELTSVGILAKAGRTEESGNIFFPEHGRASITIEMQDQVIRFTVPNADLLSSVTSLSTSQEISSTQSASGAFLNYTFNVTPPVSTGQDRTKFAVVGNFTSVFFSQYGFLSSNALLQVPRPSGDDQALLMRLNTTYEFDQPEIPRAWRVGDILTDPPGWGRSEFLGGFQVVSDYALQPNKITFPTPIIGQTLAQPSDLSLLVNNVQAYHANADAGPFSLVGIPVINGLNEITLQSRASNGQVISQTVPFYASATMLQPGLSTYNLSAGYLRHNYGQIDDFYSTPALDGTFSYGLTNYLTGYLHSEVANNLVLLGPGGEISGFWGDLAAAAAISDHKKFDTLPKQSGYLESLQFSRSSPEIGFSAGIVRASTGYDDLGLETTQSYPVLNWHVSGTAALPYHAGNLALGYTEESATGHDRENFILASYSTEITSRLAFSLSCFRGSIDSSEGATSNDGCDAGLTLALGSLGTAAVSSEFGSGQTPELGETYQHSPPGIEGLGGAAGNFDGAYLARNLQLQDVNPYSIVAVNVAQTNTGAATQLNASGSVIALDGLYFSRPTNNSFAVVDFSFPKIPVYLANQPVGQTGHSGRALVPNLIPNYPNQLSLDVEKLPMNITLQDDVITITPPSEGGVLVRFPLQKLDAELLDIRLRSGAPPPAGSLLYLRGNAVPVVIGYDGFAYLENPPKHLIGTIIMATGHCQIDLQTDITVHNALVGIPVTCAS